MDIRADLSLKTRSARACPVFLHLINKFSFLLPRNLPLVELHLSFFQERMLLDGQIIAMAIRI